MKIKIYYSNLFYNLYIKYKLMKFYNNFNKKLIKITIIYLLSFN